MAGKKDIPSKQGARPSADGELDGERPDEDGTPPSPEPLVVALGASAGGLEALSTFFDHTPPDTGFSFIVMTHQPGGRTSGLPGLLARHTEMPVVEVNERMALAPNTVFVAAPARYLSVVPGELVPSEVLKDGRRPVLPIDALFSSLAEAYQERAAGVVLSGTGSDGTRGLKQIRAHLGVTVVQGEEEARFSGMPHSAIAGDTPDFVLPVDAMGKELVAYAAHMRSGTSRSEEPASVRSAGEFEAVLGLLRARTGHDFSAYKDTTVRRRIERRMHIYHVDEMEKYVQFLRRHPEELDRLFDELLIGVTSFFRDPEAYDVLLRMVTALIQQREDGQTVRVWVAGCSTGEEAYSIAIVIREAMERLSRTVPFQVFATDLDAKAIEAARTGVFHISSAADLTPERLARFFVREQEYIRVRKELRENLVFAVQNVAEDPPLTRIDILSCRNLLIYFDAKLQKRLIPMFHHSLRTGGLLFLGSSESLGSHANLFDMVEKKAKLFVRKDVGWSTYVAELPHAYSADLAVADVPPNVRGPRRGEMATVQLTEKALLRELVPPTVVIRERGDIVHIHGRTGQFLEPAPGPQISVNIFSMAREGLQLELAAAVRQAAREEGDAMRHGVPLEVNGAPMLVDLRLRRLTEPEPLRGLFLVSFERLRPVALDAELGSARPSRTHPHMLELERELLYTKESLQSTIEELEAANEELTSTNEELQSTNEELQSTNEELETSKEELQSLNEELQTVNTELHGKVEELSRANDDMTNLLNATDIATLFLDNELNIKRHTEQAKRIIRLIPSDVGRPIGDLVSKLRYDGLVEDARNVLRTLSFKETEVQGEGGFWYLMRIMPYRTIDNVIDGLVITFVDITRVKQLQQSEDRLVQAIQDSPVRVFGEDRDMRFTWACSTVFGLTEQQLVGKSDEEVLGETNAQVLRTLKERAMKSGQPVRERVKLMLRGRPREYDLHVQPQYESGRLEGTSTVLVDVTSSHD